MTDSYKHVCILTQCVVSAFQDALLHAISEEYVEAVEILLDHEATIHKPGEPHVSRTPTNFSSWPFLSFALSFDQIL